MANAMNVFCSACCTGCVKEDASLRKNAVLDTAQQAVSILVVSADLQLC